MSQHQFAASGGTVHKALISCIAGLAFAMSGFFPVNANAAIIYNLNLAGFGPTPSIPGTGTATGSITTDGTLGVLATANITDWNILVQDGAFSFTLAPGSSQFMFVSGTKLTATSTGLFFNFDVSGSSAAFIFGHVNVANNTDALFNLQDAHYQSSQRNTDCNPDKPYHTH